MRRSQKQAVKHRPSVLEGRCEVYRPTCDDPDAPTRSFMMMRFPQAFVRRNSVLLTRWLVAAAILASPTIGYSQEEEQEKEEKAVKVQEATQQTAAPSLQNEVEAPKFSADNFLEQRGFESLQRQDEAII